MRTFLITDAAILTVQNGSLSGTVEVQASLLVLHDPSAPSIALPMQTALAASAPRRPPARSRPRDHKLPASTWTAMSALAGASRIWHAPLPVGKHGFWDLSAQKL
jgi:hypothetical protein